MEKINTPIMAQIEFLRSELYPSMPVGQRVIVKRAIKNAESLLQSERDVMVSMAENAYWDIVGSGVISASDKKEIRDDSEKLFNETFKIYE